MSGMPRGLEPRSSEYPKRRRRMRARERVTLSSALIFLVAVAASLGSSTAAEYKMSTPTPPGIASPDKVETRFGTLNFFDGFPDATSVEKIYNNLDFQRAVQA